MPMTLVSTVTVGAGGATSITFSNIPQTGKDLLCLVSARDNEFNVGTPIRPAFNGDTTDNNYIWRRLLGNGGSTSSSEGFWTRNISLAIPGSEATANTFGNLSLHLPNYASTQNKAWSVDAVTENNASTAYQMILSGRYAPTTPITSLTLNFNGAAQNSTASLYIIS